MLALHALSRPFDYSGRAPRAELWAILLITILVVGLIAAAEIWVTAGVMVQPKLAFVALGLLLPSLIAAQVRRLHDCGHSGRWLWLTLVPIASLALHAYLLVAPARKGYRQRDHAPLASILALLAIVLATGLVISRAFWQPFWIPSGSMKPTLLVGDVIVVSRLPFYQPALGDIIVFGSDTVYADLIKRVIGMPGDTVQLKDGVVYINSQTVPQLPDGAFEELFAQQGENGDLLRCANAPVGQGGICQNARLTETLPNGRTYGILNTDVTIQDATTVFSVPANHYFVLGDNRDNSLDSRFSTGVGGAGLVPVDHVIGRARLVLFSSAGTSLWSVWALRADRFFRALT